MGVRAPIGSVSGSRFLGLTEKTKPQKNKNQVSLFWRTPPVPHTTCPAARYIFLDFLKKKIQKGCRCIRAILDL